MKRLILIALAMLLLPSAGEAAMRRYYANFDAGSFPQPWIGSMENYGPIGTYNHPEYLTFQAGRSRLAWTDKTAMFGGSNLYRAQSLDWTIRDAWPTDEMYFSWWERHLEPYYPAVAQNVKMFYIYFDPANRTDRNRFHISRLNDSFFYENIDKNSVIFDEGGKASIPNMQDGNWHHLEAYFNMRASGGAEVNIKLWWDGVLKVNTTYPASYFEWNRHLYWISLFGPYTQCCPQVGSDWNFTRQIDDFEVWDGLPGTTDSTPPYTDTNSPGKNSTGWPVAQRDVSFYVRDSSNVTRSTIAMTINGSTVTPAITPTSTTAPAYLVTYTRGSNWADNTLYTVGVAATDTLGNALNETYTFRTALAAPEALNITTASLPNGTVGTPYSSTLAATGGVTPYTWDNTTVLPAGLLVSPNTGNIYGIPTTWQAADNITVRVTDSASPPVTDTQVLSIAIDNAAIPGYPTVEIGTVADTWIQTGNSQNFSTGDENWIYTWPTNTAANITLLKWNLSSVAGTVPTSATMRIYVTGYQGDGGDNTYAATVHRFTGVDPTISTCSWLTYNGTNAWTGGQDGGVSDVGASEATISITKTPQYYNVDVTNMVKEWLLNPASNKGMMIKPPAIATSESNRHIASVENPTAAFRPVLFLTYVPTPSPIQSLTVGTLTGGIIQ